MKFLVLGATFEAVMAAEMLGGINGVERVWTLSGGPSDAAHYAVASSFLTTPSALRSAPARSIERVCLRDRWGKHLMGHRLDGYRTIKLGGQALRGPVLETLDPGLQLVRCRKEAEGIACQMSDGSELLCTGVLFADGPRSKARELMERTSRSRWDPLSVACWSFVRQDPLALKSWEFRTDLGKSVELLPLPEGLVRVKLRFRTPNGARLLPAELRDLFSEFGPDLAALLEDLPPDSISFWDDEEPPRVTFSPLPGTLAVGQAALGIPLLESFDWALRLAKHQLDRVVESLLAQHWDPSAWEPACQEALRPMMASERYLRGSLHYDNALLRPLRDLLMRVIPAGVLLERVKSRLSF